MKTSNFPKITLIFFLFILAGTCTGFSDLSADATPWQMSTSGEEKNPKNSRPRNIYGETCFSKRVYLDLAELAHDYCVCGDHVEADRLYKRLLDEFPQNHLIWNDMAVNSFRSGDINASESALKRSLELKPDYALAWRNMAVLCWESDLKRGALEYAVKAAGFGMSDKYLYYAVRAFILASEACEGRQRDLMRLHAEIYYRKIKNPSKNLLNAKKKINKVNPCK
ncbi:MAG: hypothetical protein GF409_00005 [Candidatus Omnitrophica bacterium]|nr:hypothetical protein [Candidatus Omnitrophota bacterium]